RANEFPLLTKRDEQDGARGAARTYVREVVLRADIGNVERAVLAHPAKLCLINTELNAAHGYGYWTKMSPCSHCVPFAKPQYHIVNSTNPRRAVNDGGEDRLHVSRRAADDAEHFGGCCPVLQSLAQFRVALLQFFEEADILDGDHGLIGEGFEE